MPNLLLYCYVVIFGAVVGSFLNVVILRDKNRKSMVAGRSACPHCKHELSWFELLPVVSFLIQGGKCRSCKKAISWQYPLVEIITAAWAATAFWYGVLDRTSWILAVTLFIAGCFFIAISGTDIRTMELRVEYTVLAAVIGGLGMYFSGQQPWTTLLLGLLIGGGSIALIAGLWLLATKRPGMGEGDIWIAAAIGAIVGAPNVVIALFCAVVIGAIVGGIGASISKKGLQVEIPFGPFLCLGFVIALLWGQAILEWYIL